MKEYRTTFAAGFEGGNRSEGITKRNSGKLFYSLGCRVNDKVLEGYTPSLNAMPLTFLTSGGGANTVLTQAWPFPQIFYCDHFIFIGAKEGLYEVVNHTTTPLTIVAICTTATTYPWSYTEMYGQRIFTSGVSFVYYDPITTTWYEVK